VPSKLHIEINVDSLKAYLETSNAIREWAEHIEEVGVRAGGVGGAISRDVQMARMAGLSTIADINRLVREALSWGKPYVAEFFYNSWGNPLPPKSSISMDINGIIELVLIANFPDIFTEEVLERDLGYGQAHRATIPAKKYRPAAD
jgi:hypothetical protein